MDEIAELVAIHQKLGEAFRNLGSIFDWSLTSLDKEKLRRSRQTLAASAQRLEAVIQQLERDLVRGGL